MRNQRTIVFGGLLVTIGVAVAGVGAQRRRAGAAARPPAERSGQRDGRRGRDMVFVGPDGAGRRAIRLDGRGSQIGVMVSDPTTPGTAGVRIDGVDDDSPAAKAGVREGDVVVEFDGERVRSARQLTRLVQETPDGRAVKMTVTRGDARQTVDITPGGGDGGVEHRGRRRRAARRGRARPAGAAPAGAARADVRLPLRRDAWRCRVRARRLGVQVEIVVRSARRVLRREGRRGAGVECQPRRPRPRRLA